MVKVVCFDVGGVLIRITQLWKEAAQYANVKVRPDLSPSAHLLESPFLNQYQAGEINSEQYLQELATYLGDISVDDALRVHNHIIVAPYEGVDQIVSGLNESGLLTACLSNTNEPHWYDMHHSGRFPANEMLKLKMASHLVELEKPDPRIFRRFEEIAEAAGPEIVFFDDSATNVQAASELGWHAELIDPRQETAPQIVSVLDRHGIRLVPTAM